MSSSQKNTRSEGHPSNVETLLTKAYVSGEAFPISGNATKPTVAFRKLPTDVWLVHLTDSSACVSSSGEECESPKNMEGQNKITFFQKLCLNPKHTLKTQMMISFGLVNLLTIIFVVAVCLLVTVRTGQKVKDAQEETFQKLTKSSLSITARYLAESLEYRMMPADLVDVLYEATQDRFFGGWQESDQHVPFPDAVTGENKYPVIGPDLFIDWQVPQTILTEDNFKEHVGHEWRWSFFKRKPKLSLASGAFVYQGACDPEADQGSPYYLEGCTEANNNITNGGSFSPSNVTKIVYNKGKDLVPVLESIFEVNPYIIDTGLYFKGGGGGATVAYPAYPMDSNIFYTSDGCEWMNEPNPLDPTRPIGTREEIARCHQKGMNVSTRLYNPMERLWCQEQALNPKKTFLRIENSAWNPDYWRLFLGRAVYDRQSKEFITCIFLAVSLEDIGEYLDNNRITNNSHVSLVQLDKRGVIATSFDATGDARTTIKNEAYQQFFDLIDYSKEWNATEVRETYEMFYIKERGYSVYAYPIPTVPAEYDPEYRPLVLVLMSISDQDMLRSVLEVNDDVRKTVKQLNLFAGVLGLIGLVVTTFIIFAMSKTLTAPLDDMNKATEEIINNFGSSKAADPKADINLDRSGGLSGVLWLCSPKTELHQVVSEYGKMMSNFSGSIIATTRSRRHVEVKNPFKCRELFLTLYNSRTVNQPFWDVVTSKTAGIPDSTLRNHSEGPYDLDVYINRGENTVDKAAISKASVTKETIRRKNACSPLFLWTVFLIVMPLVAFTAVISAWVIVRIQQEFDDNLDNAKDYFLEIVLASLKLHSKLRAQAVADSSASSLRDLYMVTRYMGWLLFGGLPRAESFTMMHSGLEQCKIFVNKEDCPYFQEHAYCHCSWNERVSEQQCTNDITEDPRYRQIPHFLVQASDAMPNGNRPESSFPEVDYMPNATYWWDDALTVPGHEKGIKAAGYTTVYDRLRVSSAMPLFPVMYNYDKKKEHFVGMYVSFEADGLFLGFRGCPMLSLLHGWNSTEGNKASQMRPELCPLGKYGYDPRCREWYDTGKKLAAEGGNLYVTAPYTFASTDQGVAQSATSPLIDPATGEHVAQVLNDFRASAIYNILDGQNTKLSPNGFPVLIVVAGDRDENTVIGPGFWRDEPARKISEIVLPYDYECDKASCKNNVDSFKLIETMMRQSMDGVTQFQRTSGKGNLETVYIGYAPVLVRSIRPEDPSQFARGITDSYYQVYSIGLCETEDDLLEPFLGIASEVDRQVNSAIAIIAAAIAVAIVAILYVSYFMTLSITEPMFYLLDLIRSINKMNTDDEPLSTQMIVGPREIVSVITTMETLYKVVRAANDAFGAGEIEKAYLVLVDALRLFKRLENDKAVGVASNNLGNLMTVMYQELQNRPGDEKSIYGLSVKDIIDHGTRYFFDAIDLGEKAYDEFYRTEGWTARCLDFMQHLANRYFNRALFLLSVKNDHEKPDEIEDLAIRDLLVARDMDLEVIGYRKDAGLSAQNHADKLFSAMIVRARGHNMLCELGYPLTIMAERGYSVDWSLEQTYIDMFDLIRKERSNSGSTLFEDVSLIGRLQEAEGELIRFLRNNGDTLSAARVAIRMLMEDEYAFADSLSIAMDAIRDFVDQLELDLSQRVEVKHEIQDCKKAIYRFVLEHLEDERRLSPVTNQSTHEGVSAMSKSIRSAQSTEEQSLVLWIIQQSSGGFVTMEDF